MSPFLKLYFRFALLLLLVTLVFGVLAAWAFVMPELFSRYFPFYQLRPFHVSAAIFWIITGASAGILYYKREVLSHHPLKTKYKQVFIILWILSILAIFFCYSFRIFGGREYWEFPSVLSIPLLICWLAFMASYFLPVRSPIHPIPQYVWMWSTGIFFFLLTFIEQNLWNIPWFRESYVRELTIQWKANGAMVGAWNQMIYGTSLYIMVKISGDESMAHSRKSYMFYFIGFANLMLNWGHHIYNVPSAGWVRNVSYIVSMTEWVVFISIMRDFRKRVDEYKKALNFVSYRFVVASEFWVMANLLLALLMSIPAVNRYTHGTHITVAHAMGTTIGINTMILLGSLGYILNVDKYTGGVRNLINKGYNIGQYSLVVFWVALIVAGLLKGYRTAVLDIPDFQTIMQPVNSILTVAAVAGIGVAIGFGLIVFSYFKVLNDR